MNHSPSSPPSNRGLRAFDLVLRVATVLLVVLTAVCIPLLVLVLTGTASLTLDATLEPPYTVGLGDDRTVEVRSTDDIEWVGLPAEREPELSGTPTVDATVRVGDDDTDTRTVAVGAVILVLGSLWLGLTNLRRVVATARRGDPFDARNVGRLRWVALAVLALPVVDAVATQVLRRTLEADLDVLATTRGPTWWVAVVVGVGLLGLAEVFGSGSRLQELEDTTV